MKPALSKTQIDRLGGRLRKGLRTESDLRLLEGYRRTYGEAYRNVVLTIKNQLGLEPTGRPSKSTSSVIEKLQRETIRLTQIQDIAGCRVVVADINEQDRVVAALAWAELSEKFSDVADPAIKYGGGDSEIQDPLQGRSDLVLRLEKLEMDVLARGRAVQEDLRREFDGLKIEMAKSLADLKSMAGRIARRRK